jgi:hypothetical protein
MDDARRCRATSRTSGQRCGKSAILGGSVCRFHGGAAPQVKAKAEQRLRIMVDPMLSKLHELAMQTDNLKVASDCVRDALDRAGIGALITAKVAASQHKGDSGPKVVVNIGFLTPTRQIIDDDPIDAVTLLTDGHDDDTTQ